MGNRQATVDVLPHRAAYHESNTEAEMGRKRAEYFAAGARLAWIVNPVARRVQVFTTADEYTILEEGDVLQGGDVLPEFTLPLRELFAELGEEAPAPPKPKQRKKKG
jgi:Uma2 family endonuclease